MTVVAARPRRKRLPIVSLCALLGAVFCVACDHASDAPAPTTTAAMDDPTACQQCHPQHYQEWASSMHAYAADDPVFLAMNARGQRDSGGTLGTFCVNCHAPVAVREGLTKDGLNLATLPTYSKGVTCTFCHSISDVTGSHNAAVTSRGDGVMRGGIADPAPLAPHKSAYSPFHDSARGESAAMCGACHDIVGPHGPALERSFAEWGKTVFATPSTGLTCNQCHMPSRQGAASAVSAVARTLHEHTFAAVDVALTPFPDQDLQRKRIQEQLDTTLQATLCFRPVTKVIEVVLDNVGAGHAFPSGASPDRRAWVELVASANGQTIYQSGVVPAGGTQPDPSTDPGLWMLRDCTYASDGHEVRMFWEAADVVPNLLPGPIKIDYANPASLTFTHIRKLYPPAPLVLSATPDRITLRVRMRAVGDDILDDLVASGDLDPSIKPRLPTFDMGGATLEWSHEKADRVLVDGREPIECVGTTAYVASPNLAVSHATCAR